MLFRGIPAAIVQEPRNLRESEDFADQWKLKNPSSNKAFNKADLRRVNIQRVSEF